MSNFNITADRIKHVGDVNNYAVSNDQLLLLQQLSAELTKVSASSALSPKQREELRRSAGILDSARATPTTNKITSAIQQISPGVRNLLSSIGANLASDALIAACQHALAHLDSIQTLLH